jgi:hypothetical protein
MTVLADELMGMVPEQIDWPNKRVVLVRAGAAWFTDPFFDDSLDKLSFSGSVNGRLLTFAKLREVVGAELPSPRAVVLHVGRCGSTLLMRMLGRHRGTLPVGEPRAVGNAHRYAVCVPEHAADAYQAIADMFVLLDRFAAARGQRPVVKLSSWETADVAGLGNILREVPIVVLHRPASEVVASDVANTPAWSEWLGVDRRGTESWAPRVAALPDSAPLEEVCASVWAAAVEAALALPPERTLFVSYADLVTRAAEVVDAVGAHIGIAGSWDRDAALSELNYYSKSGGPDRFDPAKRHARPPLSPEALERVAITVGDVPERLAERSLKFTQTKGETAP